VLRLALPVEPLPKAWGQSTMAAGLAAGIRPEGESGGHPALFPEAASPGPDTSTPKQQQPPKSGIENSV